MPRPNQPWYWADRDQWCIRTGGKLVRLAKGRGAKKEAMAAFHRLMGDKEKTLKAATVASLPLGDLADMYLQEAMRTLAPKTFKPRLYQVLTFVESAGKDTPAVDIRPHHVTKWLNGRMAKRKGGKTQPLADLTRRTHTAAIQRVFAWARQEGHLTVDPLADIRKPRSSSRRLIMTAEQSDRLIAAIEDPEFRDLLVFLRETGCRPSEAGRVEAGMVQGEMIVMASKTTRATGEDRTIVLTPAAAEVCRRLAAKWTEGPIFRNPHGRPWNWSNVAWRFWQLREKLGYGAEATAESFRHQFATDALERGVDIETLAKLMGHTSPMMISKTYSHILKRKKYLADTVKIIRPATA